MSSAALPLTCKLLPDTQSKLKFFYRSFEKRERMSKKFFVATPPKRKSFPDKKTAFRVLSKGMFYEFCLPLSFAD